MQSSVYHNPHRVSHQGVLRGPRPLQQTTIYTPRQPRKPLLIRVPPSKKVPESHPPQHYNYPPPRPVERRASKTELDQTEQSCQEPQYNKKLPVQPEPQTCTHQIPLHCYSSDEDEEDELDDEIILRDLSLSRKKSVHDITISDDEDDEDEQEVPKPTELHQTKTNTHKSDLPPIPVIVAPDSQDNKDTTMPQIPTICAPGGFSDDEDTIPKKVPEKKHNKILSSIFFGIRCDGCEEPLSGQAITTSGKHWHTHCFQCQACHQNLEHIAFYEKEGLPYCALDYHELFSPRCDFCKTPIEEHSISALGKTYHPGHFFCRECGKPFDEETTFLEHEGHAYCEKDYYKQFGKKCRGCEEIITGDFLVALGADWHKECFVCADCGGTFTSSTFLIRAGKPYCEAHYDKQASVASRRKVNPKSTRMVLPVFDLLPDIKPTTPKEEKKICHQCHNTIQGRNLSAFGYDYHPLHFQCSQCDKILSARLTGLYQATESNEIVCKPCARRNNKPL
ncbi:uncharacterized protein B0P05DRAFT_533968 [Gilbertella persicaria]|uniref:uncharacterized protein n=1 Tax=Gilbertella persicaria TaxID=101096 RepID=UPI0022204007|nr:uncharacterized protein B0P05DRAFT_533968 [Gilbertella persicaria]KAI8085854.1 hypothetical protein B0P05DRAFT_533968 [Gilbertella persicaria]